MPLLDIIGVDHHGNTFTVALCWLDREAEDNYNEAVQHLVKLFKPQVWPSVIATDCETALIKALDKHFPSFRSKRVLCFWHISKCVTTHCKALFPTMERWEEFEKGFKEVVFAKTTEEYEDILSEFKAEFHWNNGNPHVTPLDATLAEQAIFLDQECEREALLYVMGQWLTPYHTLIVHAWVDCSFHGGTTTTSRLEGAHSVLKRWIGKPTKNLIALWDSTKLAIDDQLKEIENLTSRRLQTTPIGLSNQLFHPLVGKITPFALYLLKKQEEIIRRQRERAEQGLISTICTGTFCSSMGMPCWHMIKLRREQGIGTFAGKP